MRIQVAGISKQYSSVLAVNQLSFEVETGEIFALLGPNGAGKSSTIRMLIGLTQPDSGNIVFEDKHSAASQLASKDYGYLPEERGLFQDSTIEETLIYLAQLKDVSKSDAMNQTDFWLEKFELTHRKKDKLKTLSKGNQQKVQLISAIVHRPKIVFLDEPFSGLDPVNQEKVIDFLLTLKEQGTTIILSAHQMSLVEKLADRFLLMNHGEATLYGSLDKIRHEANLGSCLQVSFTESVKPEQFASEAHIIRVEMVEDSVLNFIFDDAKHIPELLQNVLSRHAISGIETHEPSLHDIYLNSVKGAQDE